MDITVYLPDEVAQRAKAQNVNLSRVLRDALTAKFAGEDAVSMALDRARPVTLDLRTEDGRAYRGRMEATLIGEDTTRGTAVYLRRSGGVVAYRADDRRLQPVADPASELLAVLPTDEYIAAMDALGIVPEIDLDAGFVAVAPTKGAAQPRPRSAGQRIRSVPGDLVEPPVAFIKRLAGHGDSSKGSSAAAEALASPAPGAPEPEPEAMAAPGPEAMAAPGPEAMAAPGPEAMAAPEEGST